MARKPELVSECCNGTFEGRRCAAWRDGVVARPLSRLAGSDQAPRSDRFDDPRRRGGAGLPDADPARAVDGPNRIRSVCWGIWVWLLVLGGIAPMGLNVSSIGLLSTYLDTRDFEHWRGLLLTSYCDRVGRFFGRWCRLDGALLLAAPAYQHYMLPVWLCLFSVPLLALSEVNEGVARAHGWMNSALMPTYLLRPALLIGVRSRPSDSALHSMQLWRWPWQSWHHW